MKIDPEEIASRYEQMSDMELLELAGSYDMLTALSQSLLQAELTRRKLQLPSTMERTNAVEFRRLVTVRRYRDLSEAIVARSLLESAGIPAFLRDENLIRLEWQISNFIGGIRLQVEDADREAAAEMLDQPPPSTILFGQEEEFEQPRCPRCNSLNITFEGSSRGAALASLYIASLPLPLGRPSWRCNACGERWQEKVNGEGTAAAFD